MSKNATVALIVLIVLLAGGFLAYRSYNSKSTMAPVINNPIPTKEVMAPKESSPSSEASNAAMMNKNTVKITSAEYNPKSITIKVGNTVTWTNSDTNIHTVDSANHPTHLVYPPLNLGNIASGTSKSLAFPTAGTYKYHDHLHPSLNGQVVVEK